MLLPFVPRRTLVSENLTETVFALRSEGRKRESRGIFSAPLFLLLCRKLNYATAREIRVLHIQGRSMIRKLSWIN